MTAAAPRASRLRPRLLLGLAFLVAVGVTAWGMTAMSSSTPLDPANPGPDGARALARVVEDQGVDVVVARGLDAFEDTAAGAGTTVLVTSTEQLGPATLERLRTHAEGSELVLAGPGIPVLTALEIDASPRRVVLDVPVAAACADPRLADLRIVVSVADVFEGEGCFRTRGGALLHSPEPGLWVLGATELLTNEQVLSGDNAAAALRLLGDRDRLVWYVPSSADLPGEDALSVGALLPPWLVPALWLLSVSALTLVAWRFRRLGPLAVEPLPVTVKAVETTQSRGRLYRRAGDRAHAAEALRHATRLRLARAVRLPDADPEALVPAVARHTGRTADETAALAELIGGSTPPTTDDHLIGLARALAALEEEVRRR